jgi:UDP:flavonoid glycosyltransferase YjiC (YdhE family)
MVCQVSAADGQTGRPSSGGSRVLYVSSSIGLGHVSKDLAIARELRRLRPGTEILWVAGQPARDVLRGAGETVLPESEQWRGASRIAEQSVRGGQLDLVRYVYRSLPAWAANAWLFRKILASHRVDIAVGNEAYEVDIPLVAGVLSLPVPFVMIFDFVATDAMTGSAVDRAGAWFLNALWSLDGRVYGGRRHSAIFIGEAEDIPDRPFGWKLPNRRQHALRHYDVIGHVVGFRREEFADRAAWRRRLGYGDEPLVIGSAGGTAIGREMLELGGAAAAVLRESIPNLRMHLVCGPRLPVESVRVPEGVQVSGYVPRLFEHFACADAAFVQCGASSTTELAALGVPFVYFPIDGHFEQEAVAARLERYGAGRRMSLAGTTPTALADAIRQELGRGSAAAAMPLQGATGAARHILTALEAGRRSGAAPPD